MEQRFIKLDMPSIDEILGIAIIKLLDIKTSCINTIKVKFIRNTGFPDVTNNNQRHIFSKDEA